MSARRLLAGELILSRDVGREECPWLKETMPKGTTVYVFRNTTYGCIDYEKGTACTFSEDGLTYPFFELPTAALEQATP